MSLRVARLGLVSWSSLSPGYPRKEGRQGRKDGGIQALVSGRLRKRDSADIAVMPHQNDLAIPGSNAVCLLKLEPPGKRRLALLEETFT